MKESGGAYNILFEGPQPVESFGQCQARLGKKRCSIFGVLGDGLCVACWDADRTAHFTTEAADYVAIS